MSVEAAITAAANWFIGEDRIFSFTVLNAAGAAQNISGWALEWTLRAGPTSPATLLTKTTVSGIAITDAVNGVCQVTITDTDTLALETGQHYHTLKRTDDGSEAVLSFGVAVLRLAASR